MKNLGQIMKQAQELQEKMARLQEDIARIEVEGASGGGLVKVMLAGKGEMKRVQIDPSILQPTDREMVEDLLIAAHQDAKRKLEARVQEETERLMGGLPLPPGLKLPF